MLYWLMGDNSMVGMRNIMGAKPERAPSLITSPISRVYQIIALFVVISLCLVFIVQIQINALTAVRTYVGGEGLWAKARKDAIPSLASRYLAARGS